MRPIVRGAAAVLAAPALLLPALVATSAPASAATDPAPVAGGAAWLAGEVPEGGILAGSFGPDYGLSIDVALSLAKVGGFDDTVGVVRDAIAEDVEQYISFSYEEEPGGTVHTGDSGGATAKSLVLATETGGTPTDFGGVDLVERLESLISAEPGSEGRVIGTFDGAPDASYTNTYIQSLAVEGLDAVDASTGVVTDYLLQQQCAGGFFRGDIPAAPDSQSCTDDPADTDSTARAVLALLSQESDEDVAAAIDAAQGWLVDAQRPNGSFGGGPTTEAPNTNSTGLAGLALSALGEDLAAAHASAWLRAHQLANVGNCVYYDEADTGAVAYDDAALSTAQAGPMDAALTDQTIRATTDALPGLLAAHTGDPHAVFTAEYVKAGGFKTVGVGAAAPGEAVCAMLGEQSVLDYADVDGDADLRVRIPARTATSKVRVANAGGVFDTVRIKALGAKKLDVTVDKRRAKVGSKQTIVVRGLAPGELGSVGVTWAPRPGSGSAMSAVGQANGKGVLRVSFKVKRYPGVAKVDARGAFRNRTGAAQFTVVR